MDHGVKRHDELADARGHGYLERFACLAQTVIEGPDHRIKAQRRYAGHVKRATHDGAAAVNATLAGDRKSTRLNSSHQIISYAVFCLKKKNNREKPSE